MLINSRGNDVKELQTKLYQACFEPGPLDGIFGLKTENAVREFQKKYGLIVAGIAGPKTIRKLNEVITIKPHKAQDKKLSPHFNEMEFACKGDGMVYVEPELIEKLEKLRLQAGLPIFITSGYRSPWYNEKVGGAKESRHMRGQAADIVVNNMPPAKVSKLAEQAGFGGIGIYNKANFTHVDIGPSRRWAE